MVCDLSWLTRRMGIHDSAERIEPESLAAWGEWLATHHRQGFGVWLVQRRHPSAQRWNYEESVLEALRFGWVDSTRKVLDEDRSMMWFAPRRPQSLWTQPNRERISRLQSEGRLEPAGRAAVEAAHANGQWSLLEPAERGEVPEDLAAALHERTGATEHWDSFPPSARKASLIWILTAKRPETRGSRITAVADGAANGKRVAG